MSIMHTQLVVVIGLHFLFLVHKGESYCQNGWIRYEGSCYLIEDLQRKTWTDAGIYCLSKGSHLVIIESKEENDFIKHELTKLHPGTEDQFWTAGNDLEAEGNWVWGNSTDFFEVSFWHLGEPNSNGEEDCLTFYTRYHFDWNDEHCSNPMPFICEIEDYVDSSVVG